MLSKAPGLVYPGGGIFFWHQAGSVKALARRLDLANTPCVGASAGALAATLAVNNADMDIALESALRLSHEAGVFDRGPWGLAGIWGPIIEQWLDELLPLDAAARCSGTTRIMVNEVDLSLPPRLRCTSVTEYVDRPELIAGAPPAAPSVAARRNSYSTPTLIVCARLAANLASVHVPLFIDGRWTAPFRGLRCVDGSFSLGGAETPLAHSGGGPSVRISAEDDARMRAKYSRAGDFLRLSGMDAVREMMQWGEEHVDAMERRGELDVFLAAGAR